MCKCELLVTVHPIKVGSATEQLHNLYKYCAAVVCDFLHLIVDFSNLCVSISLTLARSVPSVK